MCVCVCVYGGCLTICKTVIILHILDQASPNGKIEERASSSFQLNMTRSNQLCAVRSHIAGTDYGPHNHII